MSRSYKHKNILKDTNKGSKLIGSRKMRRKTKSKLSPRTIIDDELILPEDKSEVINDYDVCDWKIYFDELSEDIRKQVIKGRKIKKINK